MNRGLTGRAIQPVPQVQKPISQELLEMVMGVISPRALQVFKVSEAAITSPAVSKQGKAVAEIAGGLAVLYFFIKLGDALES